MYERDLFEIIDNDRESCGYENFEHFDPVASVLEHILQQARQSIEAVTGYDFINDYRGAGSEIYTYGNYMCSSYDWSDGALAELKEKIAPHRDVLLEDKWCRYFLKALEIGLA